MIRTSTLTVLLLTLLMSVLVSGCARKPVSWQRIGVDGDKWASDTGACRVRAQKLAEDRYVAYSDYRGNGGISLSSSFDSMMRIHGAERDTAAIFERCLRHKGYDRYAPAEQQEAQDQRQG